MQWKSFIRNNNIVILATVTAMSTSSSVGWKNNWINDNGISLSFSFKRGFVIEGFKCSIAKVSKGIAWVCWKGELILVSSGSQNGAWSFITTVASDEFVLIYFFRFVLMILQLSYFAPVVCGPAFTLTNSPTKLNWDLSCIVFSTDATIFVTWIL